MEYFSATRWDGAVDLSWYNGTDTEFTLTTPEQAHEIGRQLADEVLQGKYPYVLTTHIDKGHVHNHIIFCAVDIVNQRKYISNKQSYAYIRRTSDRLCKENGLSVVKPGQSKGKSVPLPHRECRYTSKSRRAVSCWAGL